MGVLLIFGEVGAAHNITFDFEPVDSGLPILQGEPRPQICRRVGIFGLRDGALFSLSRGLTGADGPAIGWIERFLRLVIMFGGRPLLPIENNR